MAGSADGPAAQGPRTAPRYEGAAGTVAGIALANALLGVLTLGFYRFWGKARLRRYLWGRVSFRQDAFEYTGTGIELLLGFLVALAVLVPLGAIGSAIEFTFPTEETAFPLSGVAQALVIAYLVQFAIYRARRYRLSRTQWRGIRAGQTGSALAYALAALAWWGVTGLTLGLAYPVMRTRLQRYRTRNTWFGDRSLDFEARDWALFGRWLLAWLLLVPTLGTAYAWYRAREFRYFAASTRYGALRFRSNLSTGRVIWIWLRYVLTLGAILGIVGAGSVLLFPGLVRVVESVTRGDEAALETLAPTLAILPLAGVLLLGVCFAVARVAVFVHPMLGEICRTLSVRGEEDFEAILQSQQARPGRGEGFADVLDVGSI